MSEWIPVTEMLPNPNYVIDCLTVVVFGEFDDDKLVDISVWEKGHWEDLAGNKVKVTHWMPLPKLPKEESNV